MDIRTRTALMVVAMALMLSGCETVATLEESDSCVQTLEVLGQNGKAIAGAAVSVVTTITDEKTGEARRLWGSGVAVGPNTVLLAAHEVVNVASSVMSVIIVTYEKKSFVGHVLWRNDDLDFALVRTEQTLPYQLLFRTTPVQKGEDAYLISYPGRGNVLKICPGEIAGTKEYLKGNAAYFLTVTIYAEPGSSGGAVVDTEGRLLGIFVRAMVDAQSLLFPYLPDVSRRTGERYVRPVTLFCANYRCEELGQPSVR